MDQLFDVEELVGEVVGLIYADASSGFGVVELEVDGGDGARCSGPLADLVEGQTVRLVGGWNDHPKYGPTFQATFYEQVTPTTVAGLRNYLLSDRFEGLDVADLERVLSVFGSGAGRVIEHEPERLAAEAALDEEVADRLHEAWKQGQALAELVRLAEPAGLPFDVIRSAHADLGPAASTLLRDDPYQLLKADRARFAHADTLARHLGIDRLDPRRLRAGARAAVGGAMKRDGHQYLTRQQVVEAASRLLGVDAIVSADGVDGAVAIGALIPDQVTTPGGEVEALYTPWAHDAEARLAEELARVLGATSRVVGAAKHVDVDDELTVGQAAAVRDAFETPVTVLTGGPGTGKTRTIQEVVATAERAGLEVALCAPTGRAAKRIEELAGHPATTIHRLLEARRVPGEGFVFRYGRGERLPQDLIVCDEFSMCDTAIASRLVSAIDDGSHLLIVGDADQLPSVGPGDVLRDLIRSGVLSSVELTEIHRQAAESRIVTLANEVNRGEVGELKGADGDVFLAETPRDGIVDRVVEAVQNRIPAFFDVDLADVQVMAPIYRGPAGVDALNEALKEALNPAGGRKAVAGFHEGDRVMQTRNDADLDVSNGDIGTVVDTSPSKRTLRVGFPRGEVTYDTSQARDLVHAWCVTVHKAQGGEWPVIVYVCDSSHRAMLWRNLAYTAVTRASRALIIVGQAEAFRSAARHDRPRNRQTLLAARLQKLVTDAA